MEPMWRPSLGRPHRPNLPTVIVPAITVAVIIVIKR